MEKRYQAFVSSTFEDLREERASVISALLRLDCIPSGMELFPAADDDSWTLIKSVIDDCDYYLVIVAGRYGSVSPLDKSYTQAEYEYAVSIGKPVIALLHSNPKSLPLDKSEGTEEGRRRLEDFKDVLKKKSVRQWADRGELVSETMTGILHLKKTRPATGWVKASALPPVEYQEEILILRRKVDLLQAQLAAQETAAPLGNEEFAQNDDETSIIITVDSVTTDGQKNRQNLKLELKWKFLFSAILPFIFGGGTINDVARAIGGLARENAVERGLIPAEWIPSDVVLSAASGAKVITQMLALGLITGVTHPKHPTQTVWQATPYGRHMGARLVAERKVLKASGSD